MRGFGFRRQKTDGTTKANKYGAEKMTADGMEFASKLEYRRYLVLKDAEKRGEISNLRCQVQYELLPNMYQDEIKHLKTKDKVVQRLVQRKVVYTADFVYDKDGKTIVTDCKGSKLLVSRDFPLRKKLMYWKYGIEVQVVTKATAPI